MSEESNDQMVDQFSTNHTQGDEGMFVHGDVGLSMVFVGFVDCSLESVEFG